MHTDVDAKTKIRITVTLENSEGFRAEDGCEEEHFADIPSNQIAAAAKGMIQGFRNMMEVMRKQAAAQQPFTRGEEESL
jgi:hypothetical protein